MNQYDNPVGGPHGGAADPRAGWSGDAIDFAMSVYEDGLEAPPASVDRDSAGRAAPGPTVPDGFLPRPVGPGPSAARGPRADPVPAVGGPVVPAAVTDPSAVGSVVMAPRVTEPYSAEPPAVAPPAVVANDQYGDEQSGDEQYGADPSVAGPAVRPASPREQGTPLPHVGRKPPAYPAEPTDIPAVGTDLFGALLPDTVVDGGRFGPVTVRAASVRGDSHRYAAECRQDAALVTRIGDLLLVAVADGVGSQPYSHHGSNGIVRLLAKQVAGRAETLLAQLRAGAEAEFAMLTGQIVAAAAVELAQEATQRGLPPKAYSTTLRALLVPADPDLRVRGFVAVGDGGLLRLREDEWSDLDAGDEDGALISTGTHCLPEAYEHVRARLLADTLPGDLLVLCTDGLSLPVLKERELRDFLRAHWGGAEIPGLADFLWQAQVRVRSYDDDRSVVCLWEATA
ncbi:protein phosphatase 2C domain-containing protein [Kitasatospora sp. NPDC093806]|uniref:protein phosphatase 2C domain-containing protein n=1 Tax=Kitasatospora sp. NPDC093806 TaxID=3155075 RepID=UPI003416A14E